MERNVKQNLHEDMRTDSIDVLVIDDHVLVSETLIASLGGYQGIVIFACASAEAGMAIIAEHGPFDAVLLDYDLPRSNGMDVLDRFIVANGGRVALFSGVASRSVVERSLDRGASGFVPKTLGLKSLVNALHFIASGEMYLPAEFILQPVIPGGKQALLKPVETQVIELLCEGLQNKHIARTLNITEVSVKMHVRSICAKLDALNRTHAVLIAKRVGLC